MIATIAARELKTLFLSPMAWTILGVTQFILGYLFLVQIDSYLLIQERLATLQSAVGTSDFVVAPLFGNAAVVLLLIAPLITMRAISEERRARTLSLLLSAPISMTEIVLGKYLGLLTFFLVLLGMIALMPLSLLAGTSLDMGKVLSGLLGLGLLLAAFAAAGLYISSLTEQPTVAAVGTFGLLLLLWILDWAGNSGEQVGGLFHYLSLLRHYESMLKGTFNSSDAAYYLLFVILFLGLTIQRLDRDRLPH